jgi:hypothetical protein
MTSATPNMKVKSTAAKAGFARPDLPFSSQVQFGTTKGFWTHFGKPR